jgi:hypothetical protein
LGLDDGVSDGVGLGLGVGIGDGEELGCAAGAPLPAGEGSGSDGAGPVRLTIVSERPTFRERCNCVIWPATSSPPRAAAALMCS